MRSSILLLLPFATGVISEQQIPLTNKIKNWWNKAASIVNENIPKTNPIEASAAKVAGIVVNEVNNTNWKDVLKQGSSKKDEWIVYFSSENKTTNSTIAWNSAVSVLSVLPSSPALGHVDCGKNLLLCSTFTIIPPALYHIIFQKEKDPIARYIDLNDQNVTSTGIVELHTKRTYESVNPYDGLFQPWTGFLAKAGLLEVYGYIAWAFTFMPSWLPMVLVSFLTRNMISGTRRMPQGRPNIGAPGNIAGGAPPGPK